MASFALRLDDNFKIAIEKLATEKGQSINELLNNYIRLGKLIDSYTEVNSQVMIKDAKGFPDETVIVPVLDIIRG